MTPFNHELLALVPPEGATVAALAGAMLIRHPTLSPRWVTMRVGKYLRDYARAGRIERSGSGEETLYARLAK